MGCRDELLFVLMTVSLRSVICETFDPTRYLDLGDVGAVQPFGYAVFGKSYQSKLGIGVDGVGDVNGDGWNDIVVSVPENGDVPGKAFLIFGTESQLPSIIDPNMFNSSETDSYGITIHHSGSTGQQFGEIVKSIGDVNGDGLSDFIIATYSMNSAFVFFGRLSMGDGGRQWVDMDLEYTQDAQDMIMVTGSPTSDYFGWDCAGIGDFNNDTIDDFACTDPYWSEDTGLVNVFFGHNGTWSDLEANPEDSMEIEGIAESDYLGMSVSSAGDVNNDGVTDFIFSQADFKTGVVYVMLGGSHHEIGSYDLSNFTSGPLGFKTKEYNGISNYPSSVTGVGDFNGDGYGDVMFGACWGDEISTDTTNHGIVYMVWGGDSIGYVDIDLDAWDGTLGFRINGNADFNYLGGYVSRVGDINGDEHLDIAFAPGINGPNEAIIIYGNTSASSYMDSGVDDLESNGYNVLRISNSNQVHNVGRISTQSNRSVVLGNPEGTAGGEYWEGAIFVLHTFDIPDSTDSPTESPTLSPTMSPTESPTQSPTDFPTVAPTLSPTEFPTWTPTTSPSEGPSQSPTTDAPTASQCVIEVTTVGSGVTWDLTDDEGDEEIANGELGGDSFEVNLLVSENYLVFLSSIPTSGSMTITVNGEESRTFEFTSAIESRTEIAGVSCEGITSAFNQNTDSASSLTAWSLLCMSLVVWIL